jgi:hypothetical protein
MFTLSACQLTTPVSRHGFSGVFAQAVHNPVHRAIGRGQRPGEDCRHCPLETVVEARQRRIEAAVIPTQPTARCIARVGQFGKEVVVNDPEDHEEGGDPLGRLVSELGRAARAGWAQTARMCALLFAVAAAAGAVLLVTRR